MHFYSQRIRKMTEADLAVAAINETGQVKQEKHTGSRPSSWLFGDDDAVGAGYTEGMRRACGKPLSTSRR